MRGALNLKSLRTIDVSRNPTKVYLWCIVAQPIISLSEVIKDDPATIPTTSGQHYRRGGIGLTGHPGWMESVGDQEESHDEDHATGNLGKQKAIKNVSEMVFWKISTSLYKKPFSTQMQGSQILTDLCSENKNFFPSLCYFIDLEDILTLLGVSYPQTLEVMLAPWKFGSGLCFKPGS